MAEPAFVSPSNPPPTRPSATSEHPAVLARPLRLAVFNRLGAPEAAALVRPCFEVERWFTSLVEARPYRDLDSLLVHARTAAHPLTRRELEQALASYLGIRVDDGPVDLPAEQATHEETGESAAELRERIAEDSRAYLAKFGRPVSRASARAVPGTDVRLHHRPRHQSSLGSGPTAAALRQVGLHALVRRIGP